MHKLFFLASDRVSASAWSWSASAAMFGTPLQYILGTIDTIVAIMCDGSDTGEGAISPGDNFATLEIPKAPSAIRPNDCNNTTRHG